MTILRMLLALCLFATPALANDFYNASGAPATGGPGSSSQMRSEFSAIDDGFDKLPTLTANAGKAVIINGGATGLTVTTGTLTLPGNFALSGAYSATFTVTNTTTVTFPVIGTLSTLAGAESLSNKTIPSPVLSGSITGTYTLAGTPTITAPTISNPTMSGGGVFGGTYTGTYTLAGTPTITAPAVSAPVLSGTATGTYTLAGTPTITAPAVSSPVLSGTATGTYTLAGTPTITGGVVTADPSVALGIASKQYVDHPALAAHNSNATIAAFTKTAVLSGASFALTLNTAVGHTGQMITFIHTGTSLTQVYTIDGAGSETIDGTTTYLLYTVGERLTIVSDGSNWVVLDHQAKTEWVDAGVMTITGTTSNPTKPTTPDIDKVYWRRDGNQVFLRYILQVSSASGSAAGTGSYLFALPTNIAFDTTILTPVATALTAALRSEASASFLPSAAIANVDSTSYSLLSLFAYDTTHFQAWRSDLGDSVGAAAAALTNAELSYDFELSARAANWRL